MTPDPLCYTLLEIPQTGDATYLLSDDETQMEQTQYVVTSYTPASDTNKAEITVDIPSRYKDFYRATESDIII